METTAAFNWLDYSIVGIILISTLVSLFRGFIREALSLAFWVLAFWVAQLYFRELATHLSGIISVPSLRPPAAFAIIFLLVLLLGGLVTFLIAKFIDATGLSGTDRVIGMLFGATRGILLVGALVLLAGFTSMPKDPWWRESQLVRHFDDLADWMRTLLPADLASRINLGVDNILTGPKDPTQMLPPDLLPSVTSGQGAVQGQPPAQSPIQTQSPAPGPRGD